MIEWKHGDLFSSRCRTLVCTVNCRGVMGKGIALEFKRRYPAMFEDYRKACRLGMLRPGRLYLWTEPLLPREVLCFPTKDDWRLPSRIEWIEAGLEKFRENAGRFESVAFPKLGCNNGGLSWTDVRPVMENALAPLSEQLKIEVYG